MKNYLFLTLCLVISSPAWAISESHFAQEYAQKVEPFYNSGHTDFMVGVPASNGSEVKLGYGEWQVPNEKAALVIVTGRSEPLIKYREVIYDFGSRGYSVYILDARGQGYSDRMTGDHEMGYVDDFDNYVTDLGHFIDQVVKKQTHRKIFMLAHSMGGAIAPLLLSGRQDITACVLASPMLEVNLGKHSMTAAKALLLVKTLTGKMETYADGGAYDWHPKFGQSQTIGSLARFNKSVELVSREPTTAIGGSSYNWVSEALKADEKIQEVASYIETPILLLEAGRDTLVKESGQAAFLAKCKVKNCEVEKYPEAKHELLQEKDSIRDAVLARILTFFDTH